MIDNSELEIVTPETALDTLWISTEKLAQLIDEGALTFPYRTSEGRFFTDAKTFWKEVTREGLDFAGGATDNLYGSS